MSLEPGKAPEPSFLNSNVQTVREDLQYSKEDLNHVEEWVKRHCVRILVSEDHEIDETLTLRQGNHLALSGHLLDGSQRGQQHREARCAG